MTLAAPRQPRGLLLALLSLGSVVRAENNTNGEYAIANGMTADGFDSNYRVEFFDVYSPPIRSRYSEVFWAGMDKVPLPQEVIQRFRNKTMAIRGYEVDQVRVGPDGEEIPVPITHAYNHHYIAWMGNSDMGRVVKKKLSKEQLTRPHGMMTHGSDEYLEFEYFEPLGSRDDGDGAASAPVQVFSSGNGGEMRLSYHGYPDGYAQLVHGPDFWQINPMQIDTWNREEPGPRMKPGPLPRNSPVRGDPNAIYSGLLECPCSDKIQRSWSTKYKLQTATQDPAECWAKGLVRNATECWEGASYVVPIAAKVETRALKGDASKPKGCSLDQKADGVLEVFWNEPAKGDAFIANQAAAFIANQAAAAQEVVAFATGAINATVSLKAEEESQQGTTTAGATVTLVGPADVWFGIGFGSDTMCRHMEADECPDGGPYTILVYDDKIEERYLDFHGKGRVLPPTIKVLSNTVEGGNRTVVVSRSLEGPDDRYYSFDREEKSMQVIVARGCGMTFAQHCGHGSSTMNFLAVETPMRVCRDGIDGKLGGVNFPDDRCAPFPIGVLEERNNPTCSVQAYAGGLKCCRHGQSLLDKDQEIPWKDRVLEYRIKFRYHFEEFRPAAATTTETTAPASHQHLVRFYWMTEAWAGEYDVTPCPPGTPPSQCVQVITSRFKARHLLHDGPWSNMWGTGPNSTKADGIKLIYAGPHCHAPSCLSMELYNADTGDLLCRVEPHKGAGSVDEVYDELGYLAIPPCLWSDNEDDGLMAPVFLPADANLLSIKRNNNTVAHLGEMASWNMRGLVVMPKKEEAKEDDEEERAKAVVNEEFAKSEEKADLVSDTNAAATTRTNVRRGRPEV